MKHSSFNLSSWSKIHTPLPRTPRQSQQLLNALTSSFRRELDREHPPTASSPNEPTNSNEILPRKREIRDHPQSSSHAADKLFGAILDNPLFRSPPDRHSGRPQGSSNNGTAVLQKEPMAVFDQLVASGAATPNTVMNCLGWQLLLISRHSGERSLKEMRDCQAGSRIVSWWFSSDRKTKSSFLKNDRLQIACKFMVAEGLHDKVFAWLKFLAHDDVDQIDIDRHAAQANRFRMLLSNFMKSEIECGGGLKSAMHYYLDACRMFTITSNAESPPPLQKALRQTGNYLLSIIMMEPRVSFRNAIPADLYEAFIQATSFSRLVRSTVSIYHPTHPDARPFVQYLRNSSSRTSEDIPEAQRKRFIRLGFDALHVLVEAGNPRDADALFVARFLQQLVEEKHEDSPSPHKTNFVSSQEKALLENMDLALA